MYTMPHRSEDSTEFTKHAEPAGAAGLVWLVYWYRAYHLRHNS